MEYIIVGSAGHVDHGKTILVKTLTGVDTDRLEEEKNRGISIKLGFAPLKLPSGKLLGIVDVPGHEKFIRQMLAGIGGIDLVMLVVAADEGVMPQTKEHLDIIDLLQIKEGVVVISKIDLVDEEWFELVKEDLKETLQGTVLEDSPIVGVSALEKKGLDELISTLDKLASLTPKKDYTGGVRLPVDRAFTMPGFGTIVTGTLWSGKISPGDNLELKPVGTKVRVRGLQVHGKNVEEAIAGQRVAVNLANIQLEEIKSGSVLTSRDFLETSFRLDAKIKLLASVEKPLKNRARVRIHLGTSENLARISILENDEIKPDEEAYVQLLMETPLVATRGDKFIIRSYSPMHTIGGGQIIEADARKLKRFNTENISLLETKLKGSPKGLIEQYLDASKGFLNTGEIAKTLNLSEEEVKKACLELQENQILKEINIEGTPYYISKNVLEEYVEKVKSELEKYHNKYHLRPGISREELRSRLFKDLNPRLFNDFLNYLFKEDILKAKGSYVSLFNFNALPTKVEEKELKMIESKFIEGKFKPSGWQGLMKELKIEEPISSEYQRYLQDMDTIIKITPEIFIHKKWFDTAKKYFDAHLSEHGEISLSEARDLLESSRKYVLPLLEYFDSIKFTKRVGDKRIKFKN